MGKKFQCSVPDLAFEAGAREHSTHPISLQLWDGSGYSIGFLTAADARELGQILTSLGVIHDAP